MGADCDTPRDKQVNVSATPRCQDQRMALRKRATGGRPGKGERHLVTSRVPVLHAEQLFARADARGISLSEYLAEVIARELEADPVSPPAQQEVMKLSA